MGHAVMAATLQTIQPFDKHRSDTEYALILLSEYLNALETALARAEATTSARLNREYSTVNIIEEDHLFEAASRYLEHVGKFKHEFLPRLRYSFIVQLYVVFETRARALCNELNRREPNLVLRVDDLKGGQYFGGIRLFLTKVRPCRIKCWEGLDELRIVRNCIVHANGLVSEADRGKESLRRIAKSKRGVTIDSEGYLAIERRYCETAFGSVRRFFKEAFDSCGFGVAYPLRGRHSLGVKIKVCSGKPKFSLMTPKQVEKVWTRKHKARRLS
jgi:hypothetical protein